MKKKEQQLIQKVNNELYLISFISIGKLLSFSFGSCPLQFELLLFEIAGYCEQFPVSIPSRK